MSIKNLIPVLHLPENVSHFDMIGEIFRRISGAGKSKLSADGEKCFRSFQKFLIDNQFLIDETVDIVALEQTKFFRTFVYTGKVVDINHSHVSIQVYRYRDETGENEVKENIKKIFFITPDYYVKEISLNPEALPE